MTLLPDPMADGLRSAPFRLAVVCQILLLGSCAPDHPNAPAGSVVDDAGRLHHNTAGSPSRIVSLIPAVTETLVALGAGERLVARTPYDEQPQLAALPVISALLQPSVEALTRFDPDLVVMWPSGGDGGAVGEQLDRVGIGWYGAAIQTMADFERNARNLGILLDLDRQADSVVAAMQADLNGARARWSGRDPVEIFHVVQLDPPMTVGPGTFLDSVFVAGGAVNAFADIDGNWPRVSLEEVLWRDPDYVVVPVEGYGTPPIPPGYRDPSLGRLAAAPGWAALSAVADGRVVSVDASLFGRPGPRMGEAARYLAYRLHGGPPP